MFGLKNPYGYDLNRLKVLNVTEDGTIVGGTDYNKNFKVGNKYTFPSGETIEILDVKKIVTVKEV
ncbi:hypothetical protein AGR56_17830 [Clostridium sp. DMHC 10]|uniref:hypothetical protein n=1 Tax=Clostridium sp. DMHC 10 TaxID=747377 RepID=UPI00069E31B7|nr:hypothetical protein [Clostridium sp. DMHC 10]KOF55699.1 hypothetical protein AGR56_17830 [Clostridium sp. DMHC 10]